MKTNLDQAAALRRAAAAIMILDAEGIGVRCTYANGRHATVVVDRKPQFARGVMIRRQPADDGGIDRVFGTPFHGVQLEWLEHTPVVREVGHA